MSKITKLIFSLNCAIPSTPSAAKRKEKAVSEKLSALERLGVVDQLSSIVVHELRQPLTTIRAAKTGQAMPWSMS